MRCIEAFFLSCVSDIRHVACLSQPEKPTVLVAESESIIGRSSATSILSVPLSAQIEGRLSFNNTNGI